MSSSIFAQLSEHKALIPYGVCVDEERHVWVASKGGLFKLSEDGASCLFSEVNRNYKQVGAFCQVFTTKDRNGQGRVDSIQLTYHL